MSGFSLLESIIFLTMISLFCLSFTGFYAIEKHQTRKITTHLFEVLQWARTEAIKRNQSVGVCATKDFQSCHEDWSYGYMVFLADARSQLQILRFEKNNTKIQINSNQPIIKYGYDGRCFNRATLYVTSNESKHKIVIYDSGRARITKG